MKKKLSKIALLGPGSALLLVLLITTLLLPVTNLSANATDTVTTYVTANVSPTIAISLQDSIDINVTPESTSGTFSATTAKLKVSTNSEAGYKIYMSTIDGTSNLTNTDTSKAAKISAITSASTQSQFKQNTWGYAVSQKDIDETTTYYPVPTTATSAIIDTNTAQENDEYNLAFGTNINLDLPTGTYTNAVTVSAVANPVTITGLQQATYMQHMNSSICTNTAEGTTKQLIDTRDGKKYWVAKLKDGNCWMTQNLALDLTTKGLSPQDSDVSAEWNSRSTYPPTDTNSIELIGKSAMSASTATGSWNIGKVVLAMPKLAKLCKNYGGSDAQWSLKTTDNIAEKCALSGFVDVSGDNWQPTFAATIGNITLEGSDGSGVSYFNEFVAVQPNDPGDLSQGGKYDAHYLIGNYYQFNAALAGSVVYQSNHNSSESICPKNWKLPQNSNNNTTLATSGTWQYLLSQYGLVTNLTSGKLSNDEYNIASAPFYFVRSGYANPASSAGYFNRIGSHAALWSGTATSSNNGYMTLYSPTNAYLLYNSSELSAGAQTGATIRCVLEGETHPVPTA